MEKDEAAGALRVLERRALPGSPRNTGGARMHREGGRKPGEEKRRR